MEDTGALLARGKEMIVGWNTSYGPDMGVLPGLHLGYGCAPNGVGFLGVIP